MSTITVQTSTTSQSATLRMALSSRDVFWKKHDGDNSARTFEPIGKGFENITFTDEKKRAIYKTEKEISSGAGGDYLTAKKTDENGETTRCMVKVFHYMKLANNKMEDGDAMLARATREKDLSQLIHRRRPKDNPCTGAMLCVEHLFQDKMHVILVFPTFAHVISLHTFIKNMLTAAWTATAAFVEDYGETQRYVVFNVIKLAAMLAKVLTRMNAFGIFHGDISPKNILLSMRAEHYTGSLKVPRYFVKHMTKTLELPFSVDDVLEVRVINFQSSCLKGAESTSTSTSTSSTARDVLACDFSGHDYPKGGLYRDPFIDTAVADLKKTDAFRQFDSATQEGVLEGYWTRAEVYSFAKIFYVLFDPSALDTDFTKTKSLPNLNPKFTFLISQWMNKENTARSDFGRIGVHVGDAVKELQTQWQERST